LPHKQHRTSRQVPVPTITPAAGAALPCVVTRQPFGDELMPMPRKNPPKDARERIEKYTL